MRPTVGVRVNRTRVVTVRAAKDPKGPRLAIVGVTGAVGQEFLQVRAALLLLSACKGLSE